MNQLLIDVLPIQMTLEESAGGVLIAKGEYAHGGVPTANRRRYRTELWQRESSRMTEDMRSGRVFGELDHPGDGKTKLSRASHLLQALAIKEDGRVMGTSRILKGTPNGDTLIAIVNGGGQVGVSSRGTGSVTHKDGIDEVNEDFHLMTFDFVADPAHRMAYPKIYAESVETIGLSEMDESQITMDILKTKFPGLYEEFSRILCEGRDLNDVDLKKAEEVLRAEFEGKLKEQKDTFVVLVTKLVQEQREDVEKSVESRLRSDPKIVGAASAMKKIVEIVSPFGVEAKAKDLIDSQATKIGALEVERDTLNQSLKVMEQTLGTMGKVGRDALMALTTEKKLQDIPREIRGAVLLNIGDMTTLADRFGSPEKLGEALDGAIKAHGTKLSESKALVEEKESRKLEDELQGVKRTLDGVRSEMESLEEAHKSEVESERKRAADAAREAAAATRKLTEETGKRSESEERVKSLTEETKVLKEAVKRSELKLGLLKLLENRTDVVELWPKVQNAATLDEAVEIIRNHQPSGKPGQAGAQLAEMRERVASRMGGGFHEPPPGATAPAAQMIGGHDNLFGVPVSQLTR